MKTHRVARVAKVIREVASETILFKLRDPRIHMTTVLRAEVSGDLQHAKVYVSVMGTEAEEKETLRALNHASGVVQAGLADRMKTRFLPVITFYIDRGVKKSLEVSRLIQEALAAGKKEEPVEETQDTVEPDSASDRIED
ncbi:MAG: 30S ribosome-binding factor RbfA [Gemmataceae bacterium]|nr:30S ribosome-binding factor RbfA [Gemmataceae bacterium]